MSQPSLPSTISSTSATLADLEQLRDSRTPVRIVRRISTGVLDVIGMVLSAHENPAEWGPGFGIMFRGIDTRTGRPEHTALDLSKSLDWTITVDPPAPPRG